MQIIHLRYQHSLLSQLAAEDDRRRMYDRLRSDRPNDVEIVTRAKQPACDLKIAYLTVVRHSAITAGVLIASLFLYNPEAAMTVGSANRPAVVFNMEHIPETVQKALPPAPPRPVVPIAVEGEEVPDSVTIEPTDLDLDALPLDLSLVGPGGPVGPISDEPMNVADIDYKPHLLTLIMPAFPEQAKKAKLKQGQARVKLLVDKKGNVEKVEFVNGPQHFREEAISTAYRYRFRPGKHQGEVRKVWMEVSIQFKYD
jgi:TonB family protein